MQTLWTVLLLILSFALAARGYVLGRRALGSDLRSRQRAINTWYGYYGLSGAVVVLAFTDYSRDSWINMAFELATMALVVLFGYGLYQLIAFVIVKRQERRSRIEPR